MMLVVPAELRFDSDIADSSCAPFVKDNRFLLLPCGS